MTLAVIGISAGLIDALALTRVMRRLPFELNRAIHSRSVQSPIAMILGCLALLACWLPARRAAKVDPMEALSCE